GKSRHPLPGGSGLLRRVGQFYIGANSWEMVFTTASQPPEFLAGFVDAIGAFVLMTLEGCDINPQTWEVLAAVER
ncbi:hypothetical protein M0F05_15140, partial [Ralstonia solanacearum]|nr:hypothetical protein [Ralstonia solanacearum]